MALAGCATSSPSNSQSYTGWQAQQQRLLDERISSYLEGASAGMVYHPEASPWGSGVLLTVDGRYQAASGRPCRKLHIESSQGQQSVLTCRASDTRWAEVRSLR